MARSVPESTDESFDEWVKKYRKKNGGTASKRDWDKGYPVNKNEIDDSWDDTPENREEWGGGRIKKDWVRIIGSNPKTGKIVTQWKDIDGSSKNPDFDAAQDKQWAKNRADWDAEEAAKTAPVPLTPAQKVYANAERLSAEMMQRQNNHAQAMTDKYRQFMGDSGIDPNSIGDAKLYTDQFGDQRMAVPTMAQRAAANDAMRERQYQRHLMKMATDSAIGRGDASLGAGYYDVKNNTYPVRTRSQWLDKMGAYPRPSQNRTNPFSAQATPNSPFGSVNPYSGSFL